MTKYIESGVFDDDNMNWNDEALETDLNLLSPQNIPVMEVAVVPELVPNVPENENGSVTELLAEFSVPPLDTGLPELVLNEFVGEMSDLVQNKYKNGFVADNFEFGPVDVTVADSLKTNMINKEENTDSYQTTFEAGTST